MSSVNNKAFPLRNTIYNKLANIMSIDRMILNFGFRLWDSDAILSSTDPLTKAVEEFYRQKKYPSLAIL